jgi:hypothetical protein
MLVGGLTATLGVLLCGKLLHSCLLWCLWRKMSSGSFKDRERTLEEIKFLFFNILYLWTIVFVFPLVISYHDFIPN